MLYLSVAFATTLAPGMAGCCHLWAPRQALPHVRQTSGVLSFRMEMDSLNKI